MIVVPDKFVFCHFPKTAGTWAFQTLMDTYHPHPDSLWKASGKPPAQLVNSYYHVSIDYLAPEFHNLPRFGFVRHPFTWYPSYSVERDVPLDRLVDDGAWTFHYSNTFDPAARIFRFEDGIYHVWADYTGLPEEKIAALPKTRPTVKEKPVLTDEHKQKIRDTDVVAKGWYDLG